jgi:aspartate ammonia-lyase
VPRLGYDVCSRLAREALQEDRGVYELVLEEELLSKEELDHLLDPEGMVGSA